MMLQDLGARIRLQREKRGLRQNDIASALQVSPQAVSKWERGENAPDIALMVPLSRLLSVTIDWLLGSYSEDLNVFEATILSSGVQVGRQKSEEMSPKDFAAWVNGFCFLITEAIVRHDGIPIKFIGPGILCFFSGPGHAERAIRAALHAKESSPEALKIGIGSGEIYLGSIGHPEYARPDIIGECVGIALHARDWAISHTRSGIVAMTSTLALLSEEFRPNLETGKETPAHLEGIKHPVPLVEIKRVRNSKFGQEG